MANGPQESTLTTTIERDVCIQKARIEKGSNHEELFLEGESFLKARELTVAGFLRALGVEVEEVLLQEAFEEEKN